MKAGKRLRTEHLDVRATESLLLRARVGVIVGKASHTIVERNLLRRRLRDLARMKLVSGRSGFDIVIRSLSNAYDATFNQLSTEIELVSRQLFEDVTS